VRPPGKHSVFVSNNELAAVAAAHSVDPDRWWSAYGAVLDRIAPRFGRYEPLRSAGGLMLGMLASLERKNCWAIAEYRGDTTPDKLQHLLSRARWDADAVRDDLRGYVIDAFGEDDAVLVVDETGDLKKGVHTVGVQRQYTGTAGRIENAQVAVHLTYAARRGHAFIDRGLYLPRSWVDDRARCRPAGVPAGTTFATKPALATAMIRRAVQAGVPATWVAGDEVYGADPTLRQTVRALGLGTCCRSPRTAASPRTPAGSGSTLSPRPRRSTDGSTTRAGRAARAHGSTPGPGSPCCPRTTAAPDSTIC
jgi:SRSO17 transposase